MERFYRNRLFIVRYSSDNVQYVNTNGNVNYNWYNNDHEAVHPCSGIEIEL